MRLDPTNPETHMHLAIQCARLGEEESVGPHLALAGRVAEIPHLRNRLGIVYAAKGDPRAETIFRELIRRHPDLSDRASQSGSLPAQAGASR